MNVEERGLTDTIPYYKICAESFDLPVSYEIEEFIDMMKFFK